MAALFRSLVSALTGRLITTSLRDHPKLKRTNFRGRSVTLAGGVGAAAGTVTAAALHGHRPALPITATAAGLGLVDDLDQNPAAHRGFRGHLRALRNGEVTTGFLKLAGIGVAATASAAMIPRTSRGMGRFIDWGIDSVILAASANLVNLLDLRPGRANKAVVAAMLLLALWGKNDSCSAATSALVLSASQLPEDLGEQTMLGDTGANALGAYSGYALCLGLSRRNRIMVAVSLVGATLASEKVSFSAVIEKTPGLKHLDQWGRL